VNENKTLHQSIIRGIFLPTLWGGESVTSDAKAEGARHTSNRPTHSADGVKDYMHFQRSLTVTPVIILTLSVFLSTAKAETLTASYYSVASLLLIVRTVNQSPYALVTERLADLKARESTSALRRCVKLMALSGVLYR